MLVLSDMEQQCLDWKCIKGRILVCLGSFCGCGAGFDAFWEVIIVKGMKISARKKCDADLLEDRVGLVAEKWQSRYFYCSYYLSNSTIC